MQETKVTWLGCGDKIANLTCHCNTLQYTAISPGDKIANLTCHCNTLRYTATHYNKLQHTLRYLEQASVVKRWTLCIAATRCYMLQHTATLCITPQHSCNTLQHTATHCMVPRAGRGGKMVDLVCLLPCAFSELPERECASVEITRVQESVCRCYV